MKSQSLVVSAWLVSICLVSWSGGTSSATAALSSPPAGTIGLLRLDEVFGSDPCDPAATRPVPIYARPGAATKIGEIVVSLAMVGSPAGGCTEREVTVRKAGAGDEALPTLEHSYEMKAAVVLERSGGWCRVKLQTDSAWVGDACKTGFMPVEDLLAEKLLYLVDGAGRSAREQPGEARSGTVEQSIGDVVSTGSAKFLSLRKVDGKAWVELEAANEDACGGGAAKRNARKVWLPLRDAHDKLTVWFNSRGC